MAKQTESQSLSEFVDRVTNVVTNLNGLISNILDEEVTVSDFENGLAGLFDKLVKVEAVVSELTAMTEPPPLVVKIEVLGAVAYVVEQPSWVEVEIIDRDLDGEVPCNPDKSRAPDLETLREWGEEGGCEAMDGCWVEPDGVCPHGCRSWLLELGLI